MSNFIEQYQIDPNLCDRIINYFEQSPDKFQGCTRKGVKNDVKKSTDLIFRGSLFNDYVDCLIPCINEYKEKYIYCNLIHDSWSIYPDVNIQRYLPGEGYYKLHCERDGGGNPSAQRHLVFMTYLNNVTDDGETFFYYQNLKVKPKKGLTLIWPVDWTHTHCGIPSQTQTKYIVTGWINYDHVVPLRFYN